MNTSTPWILISIGILLIIFILLVVFVIRNKKRRPIDYYSFFWIGLAWTLFGVYSWVRYHVFSGLFVIGIVFMILGLANKDKWKKNHRTWKQMSKSERKLMRWTILLLGLLLLAGLILFLLI